MTNREAIEILGELKKCYLGGIVDAIDMAIEAVKSQEPRVMTLDEVHALDEGDSVWMETRYIIEPDGEVSIYLELGVVIPGTKEIHFDGWWDRLDRMTDYSDTQDMKARYWSAEPTNEQREATPWP